MRKKLRVVSEFFDLKIFWLVWQNFCILMLLAAIILIIPRRNTFLAYIVISFPMNPRITSFGRTDLARELFDLAQLQAPDTQEVWNDLVDEIVEGHIDLGQLDQDQDTEGIKEYLRTLWDSYKEQATNPQALIEDEAEEDIV